MKGLNYFMKMQLRLAKPKEFQELVDTAITLEYDYVAYLHLEKWQGTCV